MLAGEPGVGAMRNPLVGYLSAERAEHTTTRQLPREQKFGSYFSALDYRHFPHRLCIYLLIATSISQSKMKFPLYSIAIAAAAIGSSSNSVSALHLSGPMQDRMNACFAKECPEALAILTAQNFQDTTISYSDFVNPSRNGINMLTDMQYALSVFGFINATFQYKITPEQEDMLMGFPTANYTTAMQCACTACGSTVEAIFQPIGRPVCAAFGTPLPCHAEYEACTAANGYGPGSSGSIEDMDLVYPWVSPGPSEAVCHPEAAVLGYKVAYNLTQDCNEDGTELLAGGGPTALALAECVAQSRIGAYDPGMNCLVFVGGPKCGEPYVCSVGEDGDADEMDEEDDDIEEFVGEGVEVAEEMETSGANAGYAMYVPFVVASGVHVLGMIAAGMA